MPKSKNTARLPPWKSKRCKFYTSNGIPKAHGCPRSSEACHFIHPDNPEWDDVWSARPRSPSPEWPEPHWSPRRDPPLRHSPPRRAPSPSPSSLSLLSRIEPAADAMPSSADPRLRGRTSASSSAVGFPVAPTPSTLVASRATEQPPPPTPTKDIPPPTPPGPSTPAAASAAQMSLAPAWRSTNVTPDHAAVSSTSSAVAGGSRVPHTQSAPISPRKTAPTPTPPRPAPTLHPPPLPPSGAFSLPGTASRDDLDQAEKHIKKLVEAGRIKTELKDAEEKLDQQRSFIHGLEQLGNLPDALRAASSKASQLEQAIRDKESKYQSLVAELAPERWWEHSTNVEAQLAGVTKRTARLHEELAAVNAQQTDEDAMDVDGDAEHETGRKRSFSGPDGPPPTESEQPTPRQQVDALTKRLHDLNNSHAHIAQVLRSRAEEVAADMRALEFARSERAQAYRGLLDRMKTNQERMDGLRVNVARLKVQRDATRLDTQNALNENAALKQRMADLEAKLPMSASRVQQAQRELLALQSAVSLQRQAARPLAASPTELYNQIGPQLHHHVDASIFPILEQHKRERAAVLDGRKARWAMEIVGRVQKALDVVCVMAEAPGN